MRMLMFICTVLSLSILVDWFTQVIGKRNMDFMSTNIVALAIYFIWWFIVNGGIVC